ncbi:MAG: FMN-binding protein [Deltaproteobacteria bacterium]|nr:FMN-binding protein [Deltaproteobacteria bacterium]
MLIRLALLVTVLLLATSALGEVFASQAEALAAAFPGARIEKRSVLLDDREKRAVEERSRAPLESRIVTLHTAWRGGRVVGYAFVDVHNVRSMPEALLVVISPDGAVAQTRMLAFHEPQDYLPPQRWLEQFDQRTLTPDLRVGGSVHGIAGATLSTRAVTNSVRRSLALFSLLVPAPAASVAHAEGG